ncbi:MAG: 3D-(3,5/4)-trihydroxycyclohexane-1,2-dione acylhydrolase (decyclizing) [Acidimicrobiia bacterium]
MSRAAGKSERMTVAEAIVRWLVAQRTTIEVQGAEAERPLFPGVYAIFGHGNVTCLGHALEQHRDELPTYRGQNEQGMALAAVGYAKAMRRRQIMVATSSIGPGATNMVTAAGVAMANRLPVLLLAGDTFQSRLPDPVLQQVEHFGHPSTTVNDAFRPVVRYWDRITHPEQVLSSLPQALAMMLDPAECGPAFLALPQDVQGEALDVPAAFLEPVVHRTPRPRPSQDQLVAAAELLRGAQRPLIIAGGGVHYSLAEADLQAFAEQHGIPIVETVAGKSCVCHDHSHHAGPIGVTGCKAANRLAADADVVLAVGTRLQDFTTGSWTVFGAETRLIGINAARFDAWKHRSLPVVGDARETLRELGTLLGSWAAPQARLTQAQDEVAGYWRYIDSITRPTEDDSLPTYAQVVGAVARQATEQDYALTAAGGFPGELINNWRSLAPATFDCEYGFSCMGYELSGAWGARMARPDGEVFTFVGDGSYLMMNSDLYSSVLTGQKLVAIVCDNGGFAVIDRLQVNQGGASYNNLLKDCRIVEEVRVDFAAHAAAMGCNSERVGSIAELEAALRRARASDRTYVIVLETEPHAWTEGGAFWEVGVPEVSDVASVVAARAAMDAGIRSQRRGV